MQVVAEILFNLFIDYLPDEKKFKKFDAPYWFRIGLGVLLLAFSALFIGLLGVGLYNLFFTGAAFSIKMMLIEIILFVLALFITRRTNLYLRAMWRITKKIKQ